MRLAPPQLGRQKRAGARAQEHLPREDGEGGRAGPCQPPPTPTGFLSAVLGYPSVPLFENYIIQDPRAFYVLAGIVLDHSFNDRQQPLPLEVRTASLCQPEGAPALAGGPLGSLAT